MMFLNVILDSRVNQDYYIPAKVGMRIGSKNLTSIEI